jgi:hypothetical protein
MDTAVPEGDTGAMATVVPVQLDDRTKIYVEAAESTVLADGSGIQEAASLEDAADRAVATAEDLAASIRSFCERIVGGFQDVEERLRPQRASVDFGLDVSVEGNVYVVKGTGSASVRVTAEWDLGGAASGG